MTKARDLANVRYTEGTTANRPTGNQGDLYYDTTLDNLYQKNAAAWQVAGTTPAFITDLLVIAGGGSGSYGPYAGGGGGAGGYQEFSAQELIYGATYQITVGAGGAAPSSGAIGNNGVNSSFGTLTASVAGGGAGGGTAGAANNGRAGGSGGGGATNDTSGGGVTVGGAPTTGQGFAGGGNGNYVANPYPSGGGGGAGAVGGTASSSTLSGPGGIGKFTTLSNSIGANASAGVLSSGNYYFAGGGGGSTHIGAGAAGGIGGGGAGGTYNGAAGTAGTVNTGGGGGSGTNNTVAAAGGSGIVVLRYEDTLPDITTIPGGLTYTRYQTGGYKYYKFTAGTGSVTI